MKRKKCSCSGFMMMVSRERVGMNEEVGKREGKGALPEWGSSHKHTCVLAGPLPPTGVHACAFPDLHHPVLVITHVQISTHTNKWHRVPYSTHAHTCWGRERQAAHAPACARQRALQHRGLARVRNAQLQAAEARERGAQRRRALLRDAQPGRQHSQLLQAGEGGERAQAL